MGGVNIYKMSVHVTKFVWQGRRRMFFLRHGLMVLFNNCVFVWTSWWSQTSVVAIDSLRAQLLETSSCENININIGCLVGWLASWKSILKVAVINWRCWNSQGKVAMGCVGIQEQRSRFQMRCSHLQKWVFILQCFRHWRRLMLFLRHVLDGGLKTCFCCNGKVDFHKPDGWN